MAHCQGGAHLTLVPTLTLTIYPDPNLTLTLTLTLTNPNPNPNLNPEGDPSGGEVAEVAAGLAGLQVAAA